MSTKPVYDHGRSLRRSSYSWEDCCGFGQSRANLISARRSHTPRITGAVQGRSPHQKKCIRKQINGEDGPGTQHEGWSRGCSRMTPGKPSKSTSPATSPPKSQTPDLQSITTGGGIGFNPRKWTCRHSAASLRRGISGGRRSACGDLRRLIASFPSAQSRALSTSGSDSIIPLECRGEIVHLSEVFHPIGFGLLQQIVLDHRKNNAAEIHR